jgi:hypothetical protein
MKNDRWIQELCKLTHVIADLRVLAGYHDDAKAGPIKEFLQARVLKLEAHSHRMTRVPASKWLFIFGPPRGTLPGGQPFRAFTLNGVDVIEVLESSPALYPADWPE